MDKKRMMLVRIPCRLPHGKGDLISGGEEFLSEYQPGQGTNPLLVRDLKKGFQRSPRPCGHCEPSLNFSVMHADYRKGPGLFSFHLTQSHVLS